MRLLIVSLPEDNVLFQILSTAILLFPYDLFNNANNFNLLVFLWFVILDTQGNQLGNLRIWIPGIHAIPTKFGLKVKWESIF